MFRYRLASLFACATLVATLGTLPVRAAAVGPTQPSVWERHQASTSYFGITSVYTCSGLEQEVKRLLLYFGARPDLNVTATCPDQIRLVKTALIHSDFYTLEPAAPGVTDTVSGQWVGLQLMPERPVFMGRSECELVQQLKELLTKNFALRDLRYQTGCMPYSYSLQDYSVSAQALKPVSVPSSG
jgi:hypothetical protein